MPQSTLPQLLLALTVVVIGWSQLGSATSLEKAVYGLGHWHRNMGPKLSRSTRSFPDDTPCLTITYLTELKKRFVHALDFNNDGLATFGEVKDYLLRFKANVKDTDVQAFIDRRDLNGDGVLDLVPDYVQDMTLPDYSMGAAREWFQLQDTDQDGFVSETELMDMTQALGVAPEEAASTIQGYYMPADLNKDGRLSFDEFKTLYNQ